MNDFNPIRSRITDWLSNLKPDCGDLYSTEFPGGLTFSIRSLDLDNDLPLIHSWVNMDYARTYWQMQGPADALACFYREVLYNRWSHSFIGLLDGEPVCQLDAYDPAQDEVGKKYDCRDGDLGIHLLLGPGKPGVTNLSAKIVSAFIRWFFTGDGICRVVAEPDHRNRPAGWLLRRLCFTFVREIDLPEKKASLYMLDKSCLSLLPPFP